MDAVLDAGNTRIKLGCFDKGELVSSISFPVIPSSSIYSQLQGKEFQNCIVSSVVDLPLHIISYIRSKCKKLLILDANTPLPISNAYATPSTLGPDRLALAVAAADIYPSRNVLAISLGTCITYNVISAEGIYKGGAISPGLHMRLNAMHHFTARLPLLEAEKTDIIVGRDTKSSMLSGAVRGLAFEIEGFIGELNKKYKDLIVILSGGDSRYVADMISMPLEVLPDLALTGLYKILSFNVKKAK